MFAPPPPAPPPPPQPQQPQNTLAQFVIYAVKEKTPEDYVGVERERENNCHTVKRRYYIYKDNFYKNSRKLWKPALEHIKNTQVKTACSGVSQIQVFYLPMPGEAPSGSKNLSLFSFRTWVQHKS